MIIKSGIRLPDNRTVLQIEAETACESALLDQVTETAKTTGKCRIGPAVLLLTTAEKHPFSRPVNRRKATRTRPVINSVDARTTVRCSDRKTPGEGRP